MDEREATRVREETLALLYDCADDYEADTLERLTLRAMLRWKCKALEPPHGLRCNWVNVAEAEVCDSCGSPKTKEDDEPG